MYNNILNFIYIYRRSKKISDGIIHNLLSSKQELHQIGPKQKYCFPLHELE
jgi:hypothetical protein